MYRGRLKLIERKEIQLACTVNSDYTDEQQLCNHFMHLTCKIRWQLRAMLLNIQQNYTHNKTVVIRKSL